MEDPKRVLAERDALKTEALRLFDENRQIRQQDAEIRYLRRRLAQAHALVRELHRMAKAARDQDPSLCTEDLLQRAEIEVNVLAEISADRQPAS